MSQPTEYTDTPRTVLRCTPCLRANARILMPSTRASRRICANSSTFDPIIGHHLLRLGNDVHEQPSGGARSNRRNTTGESQTGPGLAVEPGPLQAVIAIRATVEQVQELADTYGYTPNMTSVHHEIADQITCAIEGALT